MNEPKATIEQEVREIRRKLDAELAGLTSKEMADYIRQRSEPIIREFGMLVINHPDDLKRRPANP